MKVVYATLRRMGHVNIGYIDDSLLIGDTFEECKQNVQDTVKLVTDFNQHQKNLKLLNLVLLQLLL
jgi:hypothetical protein